MAFLETQPKIVPQIVIVIVIQMGGPPPAPLGHLRDATYLLVFV